MFIEIASDLRPRINGSLIETAPSVSELHALVGAPSRVVDPAPPAPVGHRNNQIHVYDDWGVYFNEHHYTRRIEGGTVVFWPEEQGFAFTPRALFAGTLTLAEYRVPSHPDLMDFLKNCPIPFRPFIGGLFSAKRGEFWLGIDSKGAKLASGKRSKARSLVCLSFSWPHDNWGRPGPGE